MADSTPASPDPQQLPALLSHPAVQKHLDILQGIVNRLAQNSVTCKNWCITLVAGVLVLTFNKDVPAGVRNAAPVIAFMPILIFWALDGYYHALERAFRRQSSALIDSIHRGEFRASDVLRIADPRGRRERFEDTVTVALTTAVTGAFYIALLFSVGVVWSIS